MLIPQLSQYPLVFKQQVTWGDMDAYQHVNNVEYYRYCENARIAYFSLLGLELADVFTVVASNACRYLMPVVYPDILYIGVRIEELRTSAMRMIYTLYSEQQQNIVAQAEAVIVSVHSKTLQKINLPDQLKQRVIKLESGVNHAVLQTNK